MWLWPPRRYIWLLIILKVSSPDIITIPEAVITCLFLAVLVGNAYAVDVHWGSAKKVMEQKIVGIRGGSGGASRRTRRPSSHDMAA